MDRDTVRSLAQLAKLHLDADDEARLCGQIERVLAHFEALRAVDTTGVEPSPYPLTIPHRLRADEPAAPLSRDDVLANAPATRGGCFRVPRAVHG